MVIFIAGTVSACEPETETGKVSKNTTSENASTAATKKPESKIARTEVPKNVKLTSGYNKINVKYKGVKNCKYQIKYSKKKNMKNAKTVTTSKTSYLLKKLNGNQKYYVQVRAYKNKNFSKWSSTKSAKSKKKKVKRKISTRHCRTFVVTYYCTAACCNGNSHRRTASGTYLTPGRSIAVDPRIIPLGTVVYINGHKYRAEDTGGAIKGYRIDICVSSHSECNKRGKHKVTVRW